MNTLSKKLHRYWFDEAPADRLAVLRVLVGGFALWYLWTRYGMLLEIGRTDPALFDPVGLAYLLEGPIPPVAFQVLVLATLALNVAFVLGWRFRVTGPLFAVLVIAVLSYRNSWGMIYHSRNIVVLHALIVGLAPAADALSLDALRGSAHRAKTLLSFGRPRNLAGDAAYGWPIRLLCTVTVLTYFLAGVAKVMSPLGFGWAGGASLRSQIAADAMRKEVLGDTPSLLAFELYGMEWLFLLMGVGTLIFELLAPLALGRRRWGWAWAGAAFLMHWGIFLIMGIRFRYQLTGLIFAPFFPVEKPVRWLRQRLSPEEAAPASRDTPEPDVRVYA